MSEKKKSLAVAVAAEEAELIAQQKEHGIHGFHQKHRLQDYDDQPQPDYRKGSIAAIFICFIWGIFALKASNKVRKYNAEGNYHEAAIYSRTAKRNIKSAIATIIVLACILGIPYTIALLYEHVISKLWG